MEFAIIVPEKDSGTDDSWLPSGARSFLLVGRAATNLGAEMGIRWSRRCVRDWSNLRLLLIVVFGAVGTLLRYWLQGLVQMRTESAFPYGTLLINLTGCFFLGLVGQFMLNRMVISPDWRVAIMVGFFGGYTTFSSFGWETAKMLENGEWLRATTYVAASVVAGLLLSVAGIHLANRI
jgi:fluoride exporter